MAYEAPRFVDPDGKEHFALRVISRDGILEKSYGTLTAERALEVIRPVGVSVRFFCAALEALERKYGERYTGTSAEKLRDYLARAEEVYQELPHVEQRTVGREHSSSPAKPTGVSFAARDAEQISAPQVDEVTPAYWKRTPMSEKRTKTAKKAARATKGAKKKPSPKKKAAKKAKK